MATCAMLRGTMPLHVGMTINITMGCNHKFQSNMIQAWCCRCLHVIVYATKVPRNAKFP